MNQIQVLQHRNCLQLLLDKVSPIKHESKIHHAVPSLQSPCNPNHWRLRMFTAVSRFGDETDTKGKASPTSARGWAVLHPALCAAEAASTEKSRQAGRVRHVLSMASCHPSQVGLAISRMSWASFAFSPGKKNRRSCPNRDFLILTRLPGPSLLLLCLLCPWTQPPPSLLLPLNYTRESPLKRD